MRLHIRYRFLASLALACVATLPYMSAAQAAKACLFYDGGILGEDSGLSMDSLTCIPQEDGSSSARLKIKSGEKTETLPLSAAECEAVLKFFHGRGPVLTRADGTQGLDLTKIKSTQRAPYMTIKKGILSTTLLLGQVDASLVGGCATTARAHGSEITLEKALAAQQKAKESTEDPVETALPSRIKRYESPQEANRPKKESGGLFEGLKNWISPAAEERGWVDETPSESTR